MTQKGFFIGLGLILLASVTWGQGPEIDSLKTALDASRKDTARVNLLLALSTRVFRFRPDEAIAYSREAIELSKELEFRKGEAYALKNIGLAYYIKGDYTEVLNFWKQSLAIFKSIDDQLGVSNLLSNLGAVYFNQGDDPKALEFYLESLRVSEKLGNKLRIATALTNIGAVYFNNPVNYDKAQDYYLRAVHISEETGDVDAIGTSLVNLGEIYAEKGQPDSALYYFQRSLKAFDESSYTFSYALNNIGKVYASRGDYQEALKYHTQAFEAAQKVEAKREMAQSLIGLGNANLKLEKPKTGPGAFPQAISYFKRAFQEAQAGNLKHEIQKAAKGLYEVYKARQNFQEALKYHETYESVKDGLVNEEKIKSIALLGAEYE